MRVNSRIMFYSALINMDPRLIKVNASKNEFIYNVTLADVSFERRKIDFIFAMAQLDAGDCFAEFVFIQVIYF